MEEHEDEIKAEIAKLFPEGTDLEAEADELENEFWFDDDRERERVMAVLQKYKFDFEAVKEEVSLYKISSLGRRTVYL